MRSIYSFSATLFIALQLTKAGAAAAETLPSEIQPTSRDAGRDIKRDGRFQVDGAFGDGAAAGMGGRLTLDIGGRVTLRHESESARDPDRAGQPIAHRTSVSNLRLTLGGQLFERSLIYRVQVSLMPLRVHGARESPVYDAYLNRTFRSGISVRVGQFFVPFNRLRTISDWALQLGARSIAVREFSLNRDLGVRVSAEPFLGARSPLSIHIGVFGGDGTIDDVWRRPGALVVSRFEFRPFGAFDDDIDGDLKRRASPAVALGAAFAANINASKAASNSGAKLGNGSQHFIHASADLIFKWRGFALQSELILRRSTIHSSLSDQNENANGTRDGYGATAQLSYIFPDPIELAARISAIEPWSDADPGFIASAARDGRELGLGISYYLRGHYLKVQSDYAVTTPRGFIFERAGHLARVQIDASF